MIWLRSCFKSQLSFAFVSSRALKTFAHPPSTFQSAAFGRLFVALKVSNLATSTSLRLCLLPSVAFPFFIKVAQCKTVHNRVSESTVYDRRSEPTIVEKHSEERIPWKEIWYLLAPYIHYLLGAVATAILAAIVNIQMPLQLGVLINIVAGIQVNPNSIDNLYPAALKLIALYGIQSVLTFVYISLVSVLGEHMASSLRIKLFHSLITQDVAFFDTHRTGELVARLSGDVQEFKSAFKQCISQGLKSITQTIGCVISLYIISPHMTYITVAALPALVITGTILGSFLRVLSRNAQIQEFIDTFNQELAAIMFLIQLFLRRVF